MAFLIPLLAGVGIGAATGVQSVSNALNYSTNRAFPNTIIAQNDIADLYRRNHITKFVYYELMKFYGYNTQQAKMLFLSNDSLLTPEQSLLYRVDQSLLIEYQKETGLDPDQSGGINESQYIQALADNNQLYYNNMRKQGYRKNEADQFFRSNRPVPTFSELLNWQAKEVFEPEAVEEFRLAEELPAQMLTYFGKYGVPPSEVRKYWIAHWDTIGQSQWKTLYNRFNDRRNPAHVNKQLEEFGLTFEDVKITDEAYSRYFTVLEQSPYFRDRIRGSTSEPLNFTVLQDLYRYGRLDQDEVKEFLKDYNWSDVNASLIVDAWKRKYPLGDREPLTDNIIYQYDKGFITRAEAETQLMARGADQETIDFQLDRITDKRNDRRLDLEIKNLAIIYTKDNRGNAQLLIDINQITTDPEKRLYIKTEIDLILLKAIRRPSTRQIGRGYRDGKLTELEVVTTLISYNMTPQDIIILLKIEAPDSPLSPAMLRDMGQ